jgi:hypothetical protein
VRRCHSQCADLRPLSQSAEARLKKKINISSAIFCFQKSYPKRLWREPRHRLCESSLQSVNYAL